LIALLEYLDKSEWGPFFHVLKFNKEWSHTTTKLLIHAGINIQAILHTTDMLDSETEIHAG